MTASQLVLMVILSLGVLAAPLATQAQQARKVYQIGSLSAAARPSAQDEIVKRGLQELGWIEGQNIKIEYRWAAGRVERLHTLADELVRLNTDVIIAWATPAVQATKNATQTIPIVMGIVADPVGSGFVASLARPGGNITGVSAMAPELVGKRLELLSELLPRVSRVAFLAYGPDPAHRIFVKEAQDAGPRLGFQVHPVVVKSLDELEEAFAEMTKTGVGALVVQPLFMSALGQGAKIAELAVQHRLPAISDGTQFANIGGLMYYGMDRVALARLVPLYVDKILKGTKPAEIPVVRPQTFQLVINLQTAKRLGLTIPQSLLLRADEVIQ